MASEWLRLMLEEIARKRDESERVLVEETQRQRERAGMAGQAGGESGRSSARRRP
jgi:hypothetical protein